MVIRKFVGSGVIEISNESCQLIGNPPWRSSWPQTWFLKWFRMMALSCGRMLKCRTVSSRGLKAAPFWILMWHLFNFNLWWKSHNKYFQYLLLNPFIVTRILNDWPILNPPGMSPRKGHWGAKIGIVDIFFIQLHFWTSHWKMRKNLLKFMMIRKW